MTAPHPTGPRQRPEAPSRFAGIPGRPLALLTTLAAALVAALFVVPGRLAASGSGGGSLDEDELADAFRKAFVEYWNAGERDFSPGMERVVDYWFRFHVAKAVIAAILLIVLVALGTLVVKAFRKAGDLGAGGRTAFVAAGVLVTLCALFASVTVPANIQGAVAPFASLLSMLPTGAADGELAGVLGQVRQHLAAPAGTAERTPPQLDMMIGDFARYHVAMAVIAAVVALVLIGVSVAAWRRFAGTKSADRRTRHLSVWFGVLAALSALVLIVVGVANTSTAMDSRPALAAFFDGGW
ncbi:hypothetical protein OG948_47525 (plasmid) [Embleya sp. NBC_00888]|uniref:hypothetical protein n=1 Tax=Embleya sp. NBC_00888 TaxID=2975960 RepID=UPI002F914620|nr:hypothetical protein OG948_47525 [Embleya sp. NBC_00888]